MNRHTLAAAVILTLVPLSAQAQDRDDAAAMDRARRAATRSVAHLTSEINHLHNRLAEIDTEVRNALHAYRVSGAEFDENIRRALAQKRARLAELGPDTPFRSPPNATEAQQRRARDRWVGQRLERDRLRDEIAPLAARERAFNEARESYHRLNTHHRMVETRYNQLREIRKTQARNFMVEEARKQGWSMNELRRRYPDLF